MPNISCKASCGMMLIELLIALSIGMIILGALTALFVMQRKAYSNQELRIEMTEIARAAMDMIGREVRMAGYCDPVHPMQRDSSEAPHFVGISINETRLEILSDLTGDGDTDDVNEHIIYTYDSANQIIRRNTGGGAQPFAENIQNFGFSYLDGEDHPAANEASVRKIRIVITSRAAKPDSADLKSGAGTLTLVEDVCPRNLGLR